MKAALAYVKRVGVVAEWPDDISDDTIRWLRREGYLVTSRSEWNLHLASNVQWHGNIRDWLSAKGKKVA